MSAKNIYQRILAVMEEVSYVQKEDKRVNNQYRFVSHDSVTSILHPQFVKHGIVVIPTVLSYKQDVNRTEVELQVEFINADEPKDRISIKSIGYGIDQGDKGPGKAVSYAYKYALLKTFCLETGDDPERDPEAKKDEYVDEKGIQHILTVIGENTQLEELFLEMVGYASLTPGKISKEKAREALKLIHLQKTKGAK